MPAPEAQHSTGVERHIPCPECDLWINVIARALLDLGIQSVADLKKAREGEKIRRDAAHWIFGTLHAEDFEMACQYAGVDPTWVRRVAKTAPERFVELTRGMEHDS